MQHHRLQAVQTAPLPFTLSHVQPHGMLIVGHHIMQGDPEGPSRPLREQPEEGENLVDALVVTRDGVAARLMKDSIVSKQLSEGVGVAFGEGVVGSAS
jgi:hypothetical protein